VCRLGLARQTQFVAGARLFTRLREDPQKKQVIKVFADNLRDLLLAAPAGPRVVMA
jgi:transcriptional accessory protein Tex/SPT6